MAALKRGLLLLVIAAACGACAGPVKGLHPQSPGERASSIYLVSHGWHTGIVVKRADIPEGLWPENRDFPEAEYLEVGWGERDFYQSRDPGLWATLKAALLPNPSVLHVVSFKGSVVSYFPASEIIELEPSPQGLRELVRYIHTSYAREGAKVAQPLGPGLYGNSRFYPAQGKFYLFNNCNTWTVRALRAAGYPISYAITAGGLMSEARTFGRLVRAPP